MDLTFYVHPAWRPRIRPATPRRDWMENSPERFAYRCLPLAIANAHGWEVLSPCSFEARWTGGRGVEAVEIRLDPGTEAHQVPVSLFGQGTITFHVEAIVRTPPGWNLWVGGSPNAAKDGIAPLGAVIETDWSPYSFTMNWRFTRPGQWIRFEEDEPFCFLFPVQRGVLDAVEPQIRPIEEAPELGEAFAKWSRSRDDFHAWVKEAKPTTPADKWQKLYYRGLDPDGRPGVEDHQSKLRLAEPRPAAGCPVHRPTERAAAPEPAPPAAPQPDATRALRHREWLLTVAERQRNLSPAVAGVQCVRDLTSEEFLDHFYAPGRPALIEGEMEGWPVLDRWTPAYLRDTVGGAEVEYQGARDASPDFELYKDNHKQVMPFDRFIDLVTSGEGGNDAYITAYNNSRNGDALAPLQRELGTLDKFLTSAPGMMWIGPRGTFTPLHFDLTNNLLAQIVGRKRLLLVPPSETAKLHHNRHVFSDVHDLADPARLERYPEAATAECIEVELNPGDLLYIPVGWWHQVTSLEFSVMLTYTNFLWPNDPYTSFPGN